LDIHNLGIITCFVLFLINQSSIKKYNAYKAIKILIVFMLVCYAWVFFRASSISDALIISYKFFSDWNGSLYLGASTVSFFFSVLLIILLFSVQFLQYKGIASLYFSSSKAHPITQLLWYVLLLLGICMLGISSNSFIYFQF